MEGGKGKFNCDPCGKSYRRKSDLNFHQKKPNCKLYQPPKDADGNIIQQTPKYKCDKCEATFPSQYNLDRHFKLHAIPDKAAILASRKMNYDLTTSEERAELKCVPCEVKFKGIRALYRHKKRNKCIKIKLGLLGDQNKPSCKLYRPPKDEKENIIRISEKPRFTCDPCGKSYTRNESLWYHQRQPSCKLYKPAKDKDGNIIPYQRFTCEKCGLTFESKKSLNGHLKKHTNRIKMSKGKFNCDPCGKSYSEKQSLKEHQNQPNCKLYQPPRDADGNINQQIPKYKCNKCDAIFGTKEALTSHLRIYTNTIKFKCVPCGKSYKRKDDLKIHQNQPNCKLYQPSKDADGNIIQQTPKYKCDKCEATFPTQYNLNRHLKKHLIPKNDARFQNKKRIYTITTSEERAELKCVPCEVKFKARRALYRHKKRNTCNRIKDAQNKKWIYTITKSEERAELKCVPCKLKFKHRSSLFRHKKRNKCNQIKDAPTEFRCTRCNKTFSRKEDLNYHLSKNKCTKGEPKKPIKPKGRKSIYKCKFCEKLFFSKISITGHLRNNCPMNHMDAHGNVIPRVPSFLCEKCGSIYKNRKSLKRHKDDGGCERKLDQPKKEQTLEEKLNGLEKLESLGATEQSLEPNPWFECDICYKRFSVSRSLIRHQKGSCSQYLALKAAGEFVCKYCQIVFADEQQLRCHCASGCTKAKKRSLTNHQLRYTCEKFDLKETVSQSLKERSDKDDLKVQFFCWWCCDQLPTQAEMVNHMKTAHDKEIATEKLKIADEETLKIDPAKPKIYCCYICLGKFSHIIPTVMCIRSCERIIGVSMEGFVPPTERLRQNKMNEFF